MRKSALPKIHENTPLPLSPSPPKRTQPPSKETLKIKLRNTFSTPPTTKTFTLPRTRATSTSLYLRNHALSKDGIIRLNFPDFDIFTIYAEWLRSGEVLTKLALRALQPLQTPSPTTALSPANKAIRAYTDYLGAYFLGCWLQDSTFTDILVSTIIVRVNSTSTNEPQYFLRALKPSLINLVLTDAARTQGLRRLIYAAIAKWGTERDMQRLVPVEGETCERGFVRGLMGFLAEYGRRGRDGASAEDMEGGRAPTRAASELGVGPGTDDEYEEEEDEPEDEEEDDQDTASSWTTLSTSTPHPTQIGLTKLPPAFMPGKAEDMWSSGSASASCVSWPTTGASSAPCSSPTKKGRPDNSSYSSFSATSHNAAPQPAAFAACNGTWPITAEQHCVFHEHDRLGMPCHL